VRHFKNRGLPKPRFLFVYAIFCAKIKALSTSGFPATPEPTADLKLPFVRLKTFANPYSYVD